MSETTPQSKGKDEPAEKTNGKTPKSETRAKELPPPVEAQAPASTSASQQVAETSVAPNDAPLPPQPAAASTATPAPTTTTSSSPSSPSSQQRLGVVQLMAKVADLPEHKQQELEAKTEAFKELMVERMNRDLKAGIEQILRDGVGESVAPAPATVSAPASAPAPAAPASSPKIDLSSKNAPAPPAAQKNNPLNADPHEFYAGMLEMPEPPPMWTRGAMDQAMIRTATGRAYASIDVIINDLRERPGRDPIFFVEVQEPVLCASIEGLPVQCKKGDEIQFVVSQSLVGMKRLFAYAQEHKGRARVKIRPRGPSALLDGEMAFRWRVYPDENEPSRPKLYPLLDAQ